MHILIKDLSGKKKREDKNEQMSNYLQYIAPLNSVTASDSSSPCSRADIVPQLGSIV